MNNSAALRSNQERQRSSRRQLDSQPKPSKDTPDATAGGIPCSQELQSREDVVLSSAAKSPTGDSPETSSPCTDTTSHSLRRHSKSTSAGFSATARSSGSRRLTRDRKPNQRGSGTASTSMDPSGSGVTNTGHRVRSTRQRSSLDSEHSKGSGSGEFEISEPLKRNSSTSSRSSSSRNLTKSNSAVRTSRRDMRKMHSTRDVSSPQQYFNENSINNSSTGHLVKQRKQRDTVAAASKVDHSDDSVEDSNFISLTSTTEENCEAGVDVNCASDATNTKNEDHFSSDQDSQDEATPGGERSRQKESRRSGIMRKMGSVRNFGLGKVRSKRNLLLSAGDDDDHGSDRDLGAPDTAESTQQFQERAHSDGRIEKAKLSNAMSMIGGIDFRKKMQKMGSIRGISLGKGRSTNDKNLELLIDDDSIISNIEEESYVEEEKPSVARPPSAPPSAYKQLNLDSIPNHARPVSGVSAASVHSRDSTIGLNYEKEESIHGRKVIGDIPQLTKASGVSSTRKDPENNGEPAKELKTSEIVQVQKKVNANSFAQFTLSNNTETEESSSIKMKRDSPEGAAKQDLGIQEDAVFPLAKTPPLRSSTCTVERKERKDHKTELPVISSVSPPSLAGDEDASETNTSTDHLNIGKEEERGNDDTSDASNSSFDELVGFVIAPDTQSVSFESEVRQALGLKRIETKKSAATERVDLGFLEGDDDETCNEEEDTFNTQLDTDNGLRRGKAGFIDSAGEVKPRSGRESKAEKQSLDQKMSSRCLERPETDRVCHTEDWSVQVQKEKPKSRRSMMLKSKSIRDHFAEHASSKCITQGRRSTFIDPEILPKECTNDIDLEKSFTDSFTSMAHPDLPSSIGVEAVHMLTAGQDSGVGEALPRRTVSLELSPSHPTDLGFAQNLEELLVGNDMMVDRPGVLALDTPNDNSCWDQTSDVLRGDEASDTTTTKQQSSSDDSSNSLTSCVNAGCNRKSPTGSNVFVDRERELPLTAPRRPETDEIKHMAFSVVSEMQEELQVELERTQMLISQRRKELDTLETTAEKLRIQLMALKSFSPTGTARVGTTQAHSVAKNA